MHRVEVVRGSIGDDLAAERLAFGSTRRVLTGDAAQRCLAEVVCVVREARPSRGRFRSSDPTFVAQNRRGDHVRVHDCPGAQAPLPWT
ncbi:MAG: hypothetical protein H0W25_11355 [Acidimicrobiia bacterium]|nr:hypothetical protein [Acidimicrobiia bacterium]